MAAVLLMAPATSVSAQGLLGGIGDLLSKGGIKDVIEDVASNVIDFSIVGTWTYKGSAVRLESSNQLANLGSTVASSGMEEKVDGMLAKVGIKPGGVSIMFDDDNFCILKVAGREFKGSYQYDPDTETLKLHLLKIAPLTCNVEVRSSDFALLFKADGLIKLLKGISGAVDIEALKTFSALLDNYQGAKLGLTFAR